MIPIRACKTALVATIAMFFSLVVFGNLTDYASNWAFVHHVLAMDTIFPDSTLRWRAITDPALQRAAYALIIATEAVIAAWLWLAVWRLLRALRGEGFHAAAGFAAIGLTLGFLLYTLGFVIIGGEWFAMWQSASWNGQQKAFGFLTMIGIVLVVLLLPEPGRAGP
ncbi:MAG: DUF2165 domain-containing protein [Rhodospirillales bacterium]|nr:DUF2165 domain-containing protein [Rhodospirillales bacterium]